MQYTIGTSNASKPEWEPAELLRLTPERDFERAEIENHSSSREALIASMDSRLSKSDYVHAHIRKPHGIASGYGTANSNLREPGSAALLSLPAPAPHVSAGVSPRDNSADANGDPMLQAVPWFGICMLVGIIAGFLFELYLAKFKLAPVHENIMIGPPIDVMVAAGAKDTPLIVEKH